MIIPETGTLLIWLGGAALVFIALVLILSAGQGRVKERLADVSSDERGGQTGGGWPRRRRNG